MELKFSSQENANKESERSGDPKATIGVNNRTSVAATKKARQNAPPADEEVRMRCVVPHDKEEFKHSFNKKIYRKVEKPELAIKAGEVYGNVLSNSLIRAS